MPIAGFVKLRRHQFGRQVAFGNAVPATRAYPFSGTPDPNLNWTDPEGDFGSFDPVAPPARRGDEPVANLTAPFVYYDDLPLMLAAMLGGEVAPTGGGTAKTWNFAPTSLTPDDIDVFSYEFGDDVLDDWFQFRDGIITELEISGEDQGPLTATMNWSFAHVANTGATDAPVEGSVPASLVVDAHGIPVYLKDMSLFIDSLPANIGDTQILDALHSFRLRISTETDRKRFANGTQEFGLSGYGRGERAIELEMTLAKTDDTVGLGSESDAWISDDPVDRYVRLAFESTAFAQTAGSPDIPYSWLTDLPLRYYTRAEGDVGQNSAIVLTGHAFYDETLASAFESTVVNTLTAAEFES